jgi:drug/metabolite transporter (DMT)-like permease
MPETSIAPALLALPIASGLAFAFVGVGLRQGQRRGLEALHIFVHMGLWGAVFFALSSSGDQWRGVPALIVGLGIVSGLTQWLAATLVGVALRLGPLSPMWCAYNLAFVPVALYAAAVFGEPVPPLKIAGLLLAVASVVFASIRVERQAGVGAGAVSPFAYGAVLVTLLLLNSVMHISIKHLGTVATGEGETLMAAFGPVFFTCLYLGLVTPVAARHAMRRDARAIGRAAWRWGSVAALGSIGGVGFLGLSAGLPGAVVFTLSAVFSILGAGVASVAVFGERVSGVWIAMMASAVGSVVLVSL